MTASPYRARLADQPLDFAIEGEERLSDGFRPLDRLRVRHASFAGEPVHVRREIMRAGTCAVVIPYDPALDAIVVIRQFRIGAALATANAAPIELPAGLVDEGEAGEDAAARELFEETGLSTQAIEHCWSMLTSPGLSDETAMMFLAIVDASVLAATAGRAEEDEDILTILAPVEDLVAAVDAGRVRNGFLIAGTHWFARHGRARAKVLADSIRRET